MTVLGLTVLKSWSLLSSLRYNNATVRLPMRLWAQLHVLDQIIRLFDFIIIYCSSSSIEHSNSRWGFQLNVWSYTCIHGKKTLPSLSDVLPYTVGQPSEWKLSEPLFFMQISFPLVTYLTCRPVTSGQGIPLASYFFSKSVVIPHHVREYQTSLTCYCGNVGGCMADVWRQFFFLT